MFKRGVSTPQKTRAREHNAAAMVDDGWMLKQGAVSKAFKRRYMRFRGHQILYSVDPAQPSKGCIDLRGAVCKTRQAYGDDGTPVNWNGAAVECCFVIITSARMWVLQGETEAATRSVVLHVRARARGRG